MMNTRQTLVEHVTIPRLKDCLRRKGWLEEPFGQDEVSKFTRPSGNEYYDLLIPAKPDISDYNRVVEVAIYCVFDVEERYFYDVLFDILPGGLVELVGVQDLVSGCEQLILKHGDDFVLAHRRFSLDGGCPECRCRSWQVTSDGWAYCNNCGYGQSQMFEVTERPYVVDICPSHPCGCPDVTCVTCRVKWRYNS